MLEALDIAPESLVSASPGDSDLAGVAVFDSPLADFPTNDGDYLVLSTGVATDAALPNDSGNHCRPHYPTQGQPDPVLG